MRPTSGATGGSGEAFRAEILHRPEHLAPDAEAWDELAAASPTPFLSAAWVLAWWRTADRPVRCLVLRDGVGRLRAGVAIHARGRNGLRGAADVHSGDWGVVASDDAAREVAWRQLDRLAGRSCRLELPAVDASASTWARRVLGDQGYTVLELDRLESPALVLPTSYGDLLAGVSRNLRSQLGRSRRALEREGRLVLRTADSSSVAADLESFFTLEAAGWKGGEGTAVLLSTRTSGLYRGYARSAAGAGQLRLVLLELDGVLVAGDLSSRIGGRTSLVKTAYDERLAAMRPGLVLRAEALRLAIEEGSTEYDFLGAPDPYKTRWGGELRPRSDLLAVRGLRRLEATYRQRLRPAAGRLRRVVSDRRTGAADGPAGPA